MISLSIVYIEIFKLKSTMFSKIKNLFSKPIITSEPSLQEKFDHSKVTSTDASQCPFMNKKQGAKEESSTAKCPMGGKSGKKDKVDSDSEEEEKPQGGCPFMGGSQKKRNPNLILTETGYDEPFVSKFKYYLSANKLDFSNINKKGPQTQIPRELFDNYPIYLQHTLFYNGEDYKKVRGLECCSRFMAYEELREKGNKKYNKGKYYQALDYYERSLSLFRWLEYQEPLNQSKTSSEFPILSQKSIDDVSDSGSKINIELNDQKERAEEHTTAFDELRTKYKEFFITYSDDNVKEYDGEDMTETNDLDMRKSLLVQLYLNMAAAYINLHHYSLAQRACDDAFALSDKVSQLYFRKAQSIGLSKSSSIPQLYQAKRLIEKAIQMRPNQKIFSNVNQNILKMLNLHDAAEAYQAAHQQIEARIAQLEQLVKDNEMKLYERMKEINEIEKRMIEEGKTPREGLDDQVLYSTTEMRILERMVAKYVRVIEFYTEAKNKQQVQLAKKEFQEVLKIKNEIKLLFESKIHEETNELGGLDTQKVSKRLDRIKTSYGEDIYNAGRYNFTMLEWVIKEIVKEDAEQERRRKEEEEALKNAENAENPPIVQGRFSMLSKNSSKLAIILLLIPLAFIALNTYIL